MLAAVAPLVVLLAAPSAAPAATTCALGGGVLEVQLPAGGDDAVLFSAGPGGEIAVLTGAGQQVACTGGGGPPTGSNVNVISVFNATNGADNAVGIFAPSLFGPGANAEGENGGTPEIEISVNLNNRPGSALVIAQPTAGVPIRFGTSGINTNATPQEVQPDADVFPTNVPELIGQGPDTVASTLSAEGGAGTGSALIVPITLEGGELADLLVGGEGADSIDGKGGADTVLGKGGNDFLEPGDGDDLIDGGVGADEVSYSAPAGVRVDLAIAGPQDTGPAGIDSLAGVETVFGTDFNDVLRGDGGPNTLLGADGDDLLEGRGGADVLDGGPGADSLFVRDGEADTAACGPGLDTVTTDSAGVDAVTDCDTVLFPPLPGSDPPGGGPDLPGVPDVPGKTAGRCGGKRATITGTNAGETISGTRRRDVIDARGGNDRVKALGGNDLVCGGRGKDRLEGGRGRDTISGGAGNDKLWGGTGNDKLLGASGRDRLLGGGGRDRLLGGPGKDSQRP